MSVLETLFVIGGTLESTAISSAVYGFQSLSKTWTKFPDLLKARSCHRALYATDQKAIVVVGGSETWPSAGFGECEILNWGASSWSPLASLQYARSCHGMAYFAGRVFACAGMMNPDRRHGYGIEQFDLTNSCEVLDISTSGAQWQRFPPLNLARFGLQLLTVSLNARTFLLAVGGRGPDPSAEYSVEAMELTHDAGAVSQQWSLLDVQLNAPRIDFAATLSESGGTTTAQQASADVVIVGGNRVTEEDATDSSRTREVLRVSLRGSELVAQAIPGGSLLPASRVGCRSGLLRDLSSKDKKYLVVAGGFRAWGEGQTTYGGPLEQSVAMLEIGQSAETMASWVSDASTPGMQELQALPTKLRQPATAVAYGDRSHKSDAAGSEL